MESIKLHIKAIFKLPPTFFPTFIASQLRPLPQVSVDFTDKTVIITGANIGLGLEAARHIARQGAARVILGCRSTEKGEAAKRDIETSLASTTGGAVAPKPCTIEVWPLDLTSFASVRECAARANDLDRLDVLVCNAGLATHEFVLAEGFESVTTVNVISTFLLTILLLPVLKRTATRVNSAPRVAIVSSMAHYFAIFKEQHEPHILDAFRSQAFMSDDRYNTTKLLEILIVRELAAALSASSSPVVLTSLNPGFCRTNFFRHARFPLNIALKLGLATLGRSSEMGSRTLVAGAAAPEEMHGKYMDNCREGVVSRWVASEEGKAVGRKVYAELLEILEGVQAGVTRNI